MATTKTTSTNKPVIIDDDKSFYIDVVNRTITHESNGKLILVQGDSNSERYTFEIPRVIEGHKVDECTHIEVHYINISGDSTVTNPGVYVVDKDKDMKVSEDEQSVIFSWLISHGATVHAGTLSFVIKCIVRHTEESTKETTDESTGKTTSETIVTSIIDYSWSTLPYVGVTVSSGIDSGGIITTDYADVLYTWYDTLVQASDSAKNEAINAITETTDEKLNALNILKVEVENAVDTTMANLEENVISHSNNFTKTIRTTDGSYLHFFVGTKEEYDAYINESEVNSDGQIVGADEKIVNTFAILTDDKSPEEVATILERIIEPSENSEDQLAVQRALTAGRADDASRADAADAVNFKKKDGNGNLVDAEYKLFYGSASEYRTLPANSLSNMIPIISGNERWLYRVWIAFCVGSDQEYIHLYNSFICNNQSLTKDKVIDIAFIKPYCTCTVDQGALCTNAYYVNNDTYYQAVHNLIVEVFDDVYKITYRNRAAKIPDGTGDFGGSANDTLSSWVTVRIPKDKLIVHIDTIWLDMGDNITWPT